MLLGTECTSTVGVWDLVFVGLVGRRRKRTIGSRFLLWL